MSEVDVDTWQMAQVQTMLDLFTGARGRTPASKEELAHFLDEECAAGRIPDGPILPTTGALLKIAKYGRLTYDFAWGSRTHPRGAAERMGLEGIVSKK